VTQDSRLCCRRVRGGRLQTDRYPGLPRRFPPPHKIWAGACQGRSKRIIHLYHSALDLPSHLGAFCFARRLFWLTEARPLMCRLHIREYQSWPFPRGTGFCRASCRASCPPEHADRIPVNLDDPVKTHCPSTSDSHPHRTVDCPQHTKGRCLLEKHT
jgi:hypothetical protein